MNVTLYEGHITTRKKKLEGAFTSQIRFHQKMPKINQKLSDLIT